MTFPTDLSRDTLLFMLVVAALGALGGLAHYKVEHAEGDKLSTSAIVGVVAALGALAFTMPTSIEQLGESLLFGFFGRAVLDVLQKRVTAAVETERKQSAKQVANEAITALENPAAPPPSTVALRTRLDAIR